MFINFEGIMNARDLGALPTQQGGSVLPGRLLRTARLHEATDGDLARLSRLGLRCIFDFRDPSETQRQPDRVPAGAQLLYLPVLPQMPDITPDAVRFTEEGRMEMFRGMYRTMACSDASAAAYGGFFRTLLSMDGAPVLWHCTQGKDRTGIAAALLLTALGVPEEEIRRDYFLTNEYMRGEYAKLAASGISETDLKLLKIVFFVWPQCFDGYLDAVRQAHGSLMGYLHERLGLTDGDVRTLRELYTQ